ncbi:hypothetical protein [Rahnella perminowiae]|nr:hypothetical protein [Rahnella perminowiae]MCR8998590.1 hypothetical protein [Rahnella perminowiae]
MENLKLAECTHPTARNEAATLAVGLPASVCAAAKPAAGVDLAVAIRP